METEKDVVEQNKTTTATKVSKYLTDEEIIGQCILFFIAGFETTATTLTNTLYSLAMNPEVQEDLRLELEAKLEGVERDSQEYYDIVNNGIPLLNAVIKETLRMYPPVVQLERVLSASNYKLGDYELEKGTVVQIPTMAVHYDSEYYPDPYQYNPDRFMPENKKNLTQYSYLPFGDGPRNCVGIRFAYQEMKVCLAALLQKFVFLPNDKTPKKLNFPKKSGIRFPGPFEISIELRE